MTKRFLALYSFHEINPLVLHRLVHLKSLNPKSTIVPCFGIRQRVYFPFLADLKRNSSKFFNWYFLKNRRINEFSRKMNEKMESTRRKTEIESLRSFLHKKGFDLYCDFTPMGYYNLDLCIANWFSSQGKDFDFDFLVFYEHDAFSSKSIEQLYGKYAEYDAGFVHYEKIFPEWYWYNYPPGGKASILRWLEEHGQSTTLYRCLFGLNFVSREVLTKLEKMQLPYGYCEMRWPSIITSLGFSCADLDFPMVRFRPVLSKSEIESNWMHGIFHPVHENINEY